MLGVISAGSNLYDERPDTRSRYAAACVAATTTRSSCSGRRFSEFKLGNETATAGVIVVLQFSNAKKLTSEGIWSEKLSRALLYRVEQL